MPTADERPGDHQAPDWALDEATTDLKGRHDADVVEERAQRLVREEERATRPHDEFDDPDEGGEG